jgi:hypothetical protein
LLDAGRPCAHAREVDNAKMGEGFRRWHTVRASTHTGYLDARRPRDPAPGLDLMEEILQQPVE